MIERESPVQKITESINNQPCVRACVCACACAECEVSEDSSGEVELEPEASDPEDVRELHPGALLYKACQARNLPVMAEALAHGADVNSINEEDEGKSPLMQAVIGVSWSFLLNRSW